MIKGNNNYLIVAVSIAILLISLLTFFISFYRKPFEIKTLQVSFEVGEKTGVNLDRTDILDFGRVSPKSSSTGRIVTLTNFKNFSVSTYVLFDKELKLFLSAPQGEIILPGESKNISIWLSIPEDAEFGNYSGTIKFKFKPVNG